MTSYGRGCTNQCTQTEIPMVSENSSQFPRRKHALVQTDQAEAAESTFAEFESDTLVAFLKRVRPGVCSILERNVKSRAFENHKLVSEHEETSISCKHVLQKSVTEEFFCSSISWNSIGSAIAAGYSCSNHESWCEHDSSVDIWSLNRKDFDPKKPTLTLETNCCVSFVSFHPDLPAIIIAGKMNGEILLWDTSREDDPLLSVSDSTICSHREPITSLHWVQKYGKSNIIEFASSSLDGKILLWRHEKGNLLPYNGFILLVKELPRNFEIKTRKGDAEVGITCMSVNVEDQSIFIVGSEGGGLFQCSFDSLISSSYSGSSSLSLKNPINMGFERHKGQVTSVNFSPFSRNIFLSSGSDGEIRIYSLLQPKPLMVIPMADSGINSAQWSPVRPLVLSCVCTRGKLNVFDLMADEKSPVEVFPLTPGTTCGITTLNNVKDFSLVATSSSNGAVQIWELEGSIISTELKELQKLQSLAKSID